LNLNLSLVLFCRPRRSLRSRYTRPTRDRRRTRSTSRTTSSNFLFTIFWKQKWIFEDKRNDKVPCIFTVFKILCFQIWIVLIVSLIKPQTLSQKTGIFYSTQEKVIKSNFWFTILKNCFRKLTLMREMLIIFLVFFDCLNRTSAHTTTTAWRVKYVRIQFGRISLNV